MFQKCLTSICLFEMEHKDTAPSSEGKTIHHFPPPLYSAKVSPCCVCVLADNIYNMLCGGKQDRLGQEPLKFIEKL